MAGWYGVRLIVLAIGALLALSGLVALVAGPAYASSGVWALVLGGAVVVGTLIERARYRSDEAERTTMATHGPGGGEPTGHAIDPRFRPTEERFEDPTTRQKMRVYADPTSGERRYVAED